MTRLTPLTMICLLAVGGWLFSLNALFSPPTEAWLAVAGISFIAAGMLFGLVSLIRGLVVLAKSESRAASGIFVPVATILIAATSWVVLIYTAIEVKRSADQRAQYEQEHYEELYEAEAGGNGQ